MGMTTQKTPSARRATTGLIELVISIQSEGSPSSSGRLNSVAAMNSVIATLACVGTTARTANRIRPVKATTREVHQRANSMITA
jgi:hypothetical protein